MNIQKFSQLVAMMAKIEAKREELQDLNYNMDVLTDQAAENNFVYDDESRDNYLDNYMQAYDRKQKAKRSLKKSLADFRKAVDSDEDTAWYANQCKYAVDKSDIAYYDRVKLNIMKDATNVRFGNYKYTF